MILVRSYGTNNSLKAYLDTWSYVGYFVISPWLPKAGGSKQACKYFTCAYTICKFTYIPKIQEDCIKSNISFKGIKLNLGFIGSHILHSIINAVQYWHPDVFVHWFPPKYYYPMVQCSFIPTFPEKRGNMCIFSGKTLTLNCLSLVPHDTSYM